ncbi:hypothetical protein GCM10009760_20920 [Kitasatospora kazusensis]|uniref:Uncharacterized protein n=1 Tax=Kitasatospora kazusensis TaxID=407974 RepID=A0ABP5KY71_9ACTN
MKRVSAVVAAAAGLFVLGVLPATAAHADTVTQPAATVRIDPAAVDLGLSAIEPPIEVKDTAWGH